MIFDSFRGTHALLKTFLSDKLKIFLLLQEDGRLWYLFFVPNFPCPALRHRKSKYLPQHVNSSSQKQCTGIYKCLPFFSLQLVRLSNPILSEQFGMKVIIWCFCALFETIKKKKSNYYLDVFFAWCQIVCFTILVLSCPGSKLSIFYLGAKLSICLLSDQLSGAKLCYNIYS